MITGYFPLLPYCKKCWGIRFCCQKAQPQSKNKRLVTGRHLALVVAPYEFRTTHLKVIDQMQPNDSMLSLFLCLTRLLWCSSPSCTSIFDSTLLLLPFLTPITSSSTAPYLRIATDPPHVLQCKHHYLRSSLVL